MLRRIAALLACSVYLGSPRAVADEPPGVGFASSTFELDNGLRVILQADHTSPTAIVYLWYRVGSKDEKPGRAGFAHLFEHLMFKGSKHVADGEFDRLLEAAGGWSNGSTWHDRTDYYEQVPANFLELALYLEADRMAGLWDAMSQAVLDNQRDVVENERRENYEDAPYGKADLIVQRALWPKGHGNHSPPIGSMKDLRAAKLAEVEEFYRSYYVPGNAVLVIVGDIDPAKTRKLVERYFGWIPARPVPQHVALEAPVAPRSGEVRLRANDDVQVPKVIVDWRSPTPYTEGDISLTVAAQILAGGKTSRLYRRLVFDARLASYVEAGQTPQMLGGTFEISALAKENVAPEPILVAIDEEVRNLATTPPTADELTRAKRMLEAELLQALESFEARANRLARYVAYTGTPDFLARELELLRSVTAEGVQKAVATWLRSDARVVMFVMPGKKGGR